MNEWVTYAGAAAVAMRDVSTISKWVTRGHLVARKIGPSLCVRTADVLRVEAAMRKRRKGS